MLSTLFSKMINRSYDGVLYDRFLLLVVTLLLIIGFLMVSSASMSEGVRLVDDPYFFIKKQGVFILSGLVILCIVMTLPMHWLNYMSGYLVIFSWFLLLLVLLFGKSINGSTRWLSLGIFNFQVSELAKLILFIYIASYLVRRYQELIEETMGFIKPIFVLGIYSFFILLEPDLGTTVVMFVTVMGMLFLAGARTAEFFGLTLLGLILIGFLIYFEPYRMSRLISFINPWEDPFGTGYQLTQSLMAYGRGELLGNGIGLSVQKLYFLPEAHTDFIFAILGEELGLIGVTFVFTLLMILSLRAIWIGLLSLLNHQHFSGYLAYGIGIWFCFQSVVNVGASLGILPTKGLTVPLISYGGSSLWITLTAIGILFRIDYERRLSLQVMKKKE